MVGDRIAAKNCNCIFKNQCCSTYTIEVRAQRVLGVPSLAEGLLVGASHVVGLGLVADGELCQLAQRQRLLVRLARARVRAARGPRRRRTARAAAACAHILSLINISIKLKKKGILENVKVRQRR